ncbi:MAG: chemotaxis protein CheW [Armatimonadetes bacterium]|nr:chemotaxis protein CheW [Armatimonadota bacterium]
MSSGMDMSDLLALFMEEAEEQLVKLDDGLLQLEKDPGNIEILKEVFRAAHTLKGSSGTMGLSEIAGLTHVMENLLDLLRSGTHTATPEAIDLLLEGTDDLRTLLGQLSRSETMNVDTAALVENLRAMCAAGSNAEPVKIAAESASVSSTIAAPANGIALKLKIADDCLMPGVRAFMIYNALCDYGQVISADPPQENIDDLIAGQEINIVFEPNTESSDQSVLDAIGRLSEIQVLDHRLAGEGEAPAEPQTDIRASDVSCFGILMPKPIAENGIALKVKIAQNCFMPGVRAFMLYNALIDLGQVISANPPQDNIDDLIAGQEINVVFELNADTTEQNILDAIAGLCEVELLEHKFLNESEPVAKSQCSGAISDAPVVPEATIAAKAIQTVRVGVDRLDTLMNLVAELVIDRTRMNQIGNALNLKYENEDLCQGLNETGVHIGRVVTELQEHIMKVRLLPVEQVFSRFPRMVRDLSRKAGKDVELVLEGQETELDRSILEDIVDPLTHLLRNALDHGVETSEERKAAGKSAKSRVILAAMQEENRIIIEVRDDGHGISIEKVKAAALKKGTVSEETLSHMSDEDALQLIFASGVSTAEKVTDISGRGVGMDVVRSNIQGLSGSVEVHTELGKGTRFRINLPLTLAIIQSLVIGVCDKVYVIPLSAVVETFRCRAEDMHSIDGHPAINFRGSVLHLVKLSDVFGIKSVNGITLRCGDVRIRDCGRTNNKSDSDDWITFVVVRTGGLKIGLIVDRLIGEQEVVIKPLGAFFGDIDGIAGATILGDGAVALIIDVGSLGSIFNRRKLERVA